MKCKHCPYGIPPETCKDGHVCIKSERRAVIITILISVAVVAIGYIISSEELSNIGLIGICLAIFEGVGVFIHWVAFRIAGNSPDPPEGG